MNNLPYKETTCIGPHCRWVGTQMARPSTHPYCHSDGAEAVQGWPKTG